MKVLYFVLSFLIMEPTSAKDEVISLDMCQQLAVVGYINHAQIDNHSHFELVSAGKYSLDLVSKDHNLTTKTTLVVDIGASKKSYLIFNSCSDKATSVLELD